MLQARRWSTQLRAAGQLAKHVHHGTLQQASYSSYTLRCAPLRATSE
jgi:hypothetical protein